MELRVPRGEAVESVHLSQGSETGLRKVAGPADAASDRRRSESTEQCSQTSRIPRLDDFDQLGLEGVAPPVPETLAQRNGVRLFCAESKCNEALESILRHRRCPERERSRMLYVRESKRLSLPRKIRCDVERIAPNIEQSTHDLPYNTKDSATNANRRISTSLHSNHAFGLAAQRFASRRIARRSSTISSISRTNIPQYSSFQNILLSFGTLQSDP